MTTQRIKHILKSGNPGDAVTIKGWVRTKRDSKAFSFLDINDGSSMTGLQVIADAKIDGYDDAMKRITTGASGRRCRYFGRVAGQGAAGRTAGQ